MKDNKIIQHCESGGALLKIRAEPMYKPGTVSKMNQVLYPQTKVGIYWFHVHRATAVAITFDLCAR